MSTEFNSDNPKSLKIQVESTDLTQFEKDLYRLAMIRGRFYNVFNLLPNLPEEKSFYPFKSSIREYSIIQLHNFIKIRNSVRRDLRLIKREIVDISLKPFWEPIFKQKDAIKEFRNQYLAHLQEDENAFSKTIEQILYDSKFAGSWNDITFYAGCVLNYSHFIELNFQTEWYSAQAKYNLSNILDRIEVLFPRSDVHHIQDVNSELKKVIDLAVGNLKSNNLKHDLGSNLEQWNFSYTEKFNDASNSPSKT
jgi:hypothetical protein